MHTRKSVRLEVAPLTYLRRGHSLISIPMTHQSTCLTRYVCHFQLEILIQSTDFHIQTRIWVLDISTLLATRVWQDQLLSPLTRQMLSLSSALTRALCLVRRLIPFRPHTRCFLPTSRVSLRPSTGTTSRTWHRRALLLFHHPLCALRCCNAS